MTLTVSTMLPLGSKAPDFTLPDAVSGKQLCLSTLKSPIATVIMFICNHCPYVIHIQEKLTQVCQAYKEKGIQFIAINANNVAAYPDDAPEKMQQLAKKLNFSFPYLYDETQQVAKSYQAACTPDFYIFKGNDLECVYRGRFDNASPGKTNVAITGKDLCQALDDVLNNRDVSPEQKPSMGCNIKWKK